MTDIRLSYQTVEFGSIDIHYCTLRDRQQFHDPYEVAENLGISSAQWPLFGVVWPSSIVLALIVNELKLEAKRVLEIGCGIALPSLLLNSKRTDITATDYHPEVEAFLVRNSILNGGAKIPFVRTGWADKNDKLGAFDLIIGSDLLYEDDHILLLSSFINSHAKPKSEIILVDPGRGRKNKVINALKDFGFDSSFLAPPKDLAMIGDFKGHIIKFERLQPCQI